MLTSNRPVASKYDAEKCFLDSWLIFSAVLPSFTLHKLSFFGRSSFNKLFKIAEDSLAPTDHGNLVDVDDALSEPELLLRQIMLLCPKHQ